MLLELLSKTPWLVAAFGMCFFCAVVAGQEQKPLSEEELRCIQTRAELTSAQVTIELQARRIQSLEKALKEKEGLK